MYVPRTKYSYHVKHHTNPMRSLLLTNLTDRKLSPTKVMVTQQFLVEPEFKPNFWFQSHYIHYL